MTGRGAGRGRSRPDSGIGGARTENWHGAEQTGRGQPKRSVWQGSRLSRARAQPNRADDAGQGKSETTSPPSSRDRHSGPAPRGETEKLILEDRRVSVARTRSGRRGKQHAPRAARPKTQTGRWAVRLPSPTGGEETEPRPGFARRTTNFHDDTKRGVRLMSNSPAGEPVARRALRRRAGLRGRHPAHGGRAAASP